MQQNGFYYNLGALMKTFQCHHDIKWYCIIRNKITNKNLLLLCQEVNSLHWCWGEGEVGGGGWCRAATMPNLLTEQQRAVVQV